MIWDVFAVRMDVIAIQHTGVRSNLYIQHNHVTKLLMSRPCPCCSLSMLPNHDGLILRLMSELRWTAPTAIPNCKEVVMTLFGIVDHLDVLDFKPNAVQKNLVQKKVCQQEANHI